MNLQRAGNAASVRARLETLARERGVEFQLILSEFAIERLLYRLGRSRHAEHFVLKGAALLRLWSQGEASRRRATWDVDLLGHGASGVDAVVEKIRDLCAEPAVDAIEFVPESVVGAQMRLPDEYGGVRVRLEARLGQARIPVQVDIGFGDAVVPAPARIVWPT